MEWYKKIANNCQKATFLIEKKKLSGISLLQKVELRIHLTGCSVCRLYERQSLVIDQLLKQTRSENVSKDTRLNEEFKKALQEKISWQLRKE